MKNNLYINIYTPEKSFFNGVNIGISNNITDEIEILEQIEYIGDIYINGVLYSTSIKEYQSKIEQLEFENSFYIKNFNKLLSLLLSSTIGGNNGSCNKS